MMFWGLSVPAKERTDIVPYDDDFDYVHVSQASLGPDAKDGERVFVQARQLVSDDYFTNPEEDEDEDGKPAVILGVLCKGKVDHMHLDLVFDRPFELFHTGSGSVHFSGYKTSDPDNQEMPNDDDEQTAYIIAHILYFIYSFHFGLWAIWTWQIAEILCLFVMIVGKVYYDNFYGPNKKKKEAEDER